MDNRVDRRNLQPQPTEMELVAQWLAEAGITVEQIEDQPSICSVCLPRMHAAA